MVRAGPVDALPVDQDVEVPALEAAQHDVVRDPALAQPPQARLRAQGLPDVDGRGSRAARRPRASRRGLADDAHRLLEGRHVERPDRATCPRRHGRRPRLRRVPEPGQRGPDLVAAGRELGRPERAQAARRKARATARLALEITSTTPAGAPRREMIACPATRPRGPSACAAFAARPQNRTNTDILMTPSPGRHSRTTARAPPDSDARVDGGRRQAGRGCLGGGTAGAWGRARGRMPAPVRRSRCGSGTAGSDSSREALPRSRAVPRPGSPPFARSRRPAAGRGGHLGRPCLPSSSSAR